MKKLTNKRIVFAGQRKAEEIKSIIENYGGTYLHRPAQGTVFLNDEQLEKDVRTIISGYFDWIILTTGMGSEALLNKAAEMKAEDPFLAELRRLSIGIRGYKTAKFLARMNLEPAVRDDDGSNDGLLRELEKHDFSGKKVAIQLHGERAPKLAEFFKAQGAECVEIQPYLHVAPDEETMRSLVEEIIHKDVDAVYFTSKPQGRFLMDFARKYGAEEQVTQAFFDHVVALAIGKVTAQALREEGIERLVVPDHERMGSAIVELVNYYEEMKG